MKSLLLFIYLIPLVCLPVVYVDQTELKSFRNYDLQGNILTTKDPGPVTIYTETAKGIRYIHVKRTEEIHGSFEKALKFYLAFDQRCDNTLSNKRYFLKNSKKCTIEQKGMIEYIRLKQIAQTPNSQHLIVGISTYNSFKVGPFPIKELARTYQEYLINYDKSQLKISAKILRDNEIKKIFGRNDTEISKNPIFGQTNIVIKKIDANKIKMEISFASKINHSVIKMKIATPIVFQQTYNTTANPFNALRSYLNETR